MSPSRAIYLAVFSNGARPAHWAIFIPTLADKQKGKVILVTGNTATGFFLEFKRNYDLRLEDRKYEILHLADVPGHLVHDVTGDGKPGLDTIARDRLESLAITVPLPGPSARPFDPSVSILWYVCS